MKRLFLLALLCACAMTVRAQEFNQSYNFTYAPQTNGPMTGQDFTNGGIGSWFIQWQVAGPVTVCAVEVDSSNDGVTWGSADVIASQNCKTANGKGSASSTTTFASKYVRINVTALVGGSLNVTLKGYFGNSAGSGANPAGNNGDLQSRNGSNLSASHVNDNGSVISTSEDTQLIGPNPYVDIRAYNARSTTISTTCTGTGGTSALTVGSSSFVNGDGIDCVGAGATAVMTTPGAPTVTPGLTSSGTQSDATIATGAAATGSTTYNYKVFAVSRTGEVTAPSSVTTITNGLSALGKNSVTLNSLTLLNNTLTYASASATGLVANAVVHITAGTNSSSLSGWLPVTTIDSSTQAHTASMSVYSPTTVSSATGTLVDFVANQVTWTAVTGAFTYGICSDRGSPGTYHVIGYTYPTSTSGGAVITTFDDFGFSVTTPPFWYITDAQCTGSAINSLYVGTVSAGGGTTSLTVSPALTNSASAASSRFDDEPTILAAANAAKSANAQLYIPTGTWPLNSQLSLPSSLGVQQCGSITANATLIINSSLTWVGSCRINGGTPQFSTIGPPQIQENSYPGLMSIEAAGSISFTNVDFFAPDQGLGTVIDGSSGTGFSFHSVNFRTGTTASDTTGVALIIRGGLYFDIGDYFLSGGPDQVIDKTWTPALYAPVAFGPGAIGEIQMRHGTWNRRGVLAFDNPAGLTWQVYDVARQGGITPQFWFQQSTSGVTGGTVSAINLHGDTESQAKLAFICNISCGGFVPTTQLQTVNATSTDGGGRPSNITGNGGSYVTPEESGANFHGWTYGLGAIGATDNIFLPSVPANSFSTTTVLPVFTANRTITVPDANTVLPQPLASSARTVVTGLSSTTGSLTAAIQQQCYNPTTPGTTITGTYTVQSSDFACTLLVTGGPVTVPDANSAGFQNGFDFTLTNPGTTIVTVNRQTSSTFSVNGSAALTTFTINPGQSFYISQQGSSTNWLGNSLIGAGQGADPLIAYFLSPNCPPSNTGQCFFSPANTQQNNDAKWTAASPTVTAYTHVSSVSGSVTSNVATYTAPLAGLIPSSWTSGDTIVISGFTGGDTYLNQTCTVSSVTATTVVCPLTHANASSTTFGTIQDQSHGPFVATDVGKQVMGWQSCNASLPLGGLSGLGTNAITTNTAVTILTFTNSTSIVLSANASNTQSTPSGCFIWGTPDDTYAAAVEGAYDVAPFCAKLMLGAANYWFNSPHFFTQPTACGNLGTANGVVGNVYYSGGFELEGRGMGTTNIYLGTNFPNGDPCTHVDAGGIGSGKACFLLQPEAKWMNFSITGGSNGNPTLTGAPSVVNIIETVAANTIEDVMLTNFGGTNPGSGNIPIGVFAGVQLQLKQVDLNAWGYNGVQLSASPGGGGFLTAVQLAIESIPQYDMYIPGVPCCGGNSGGFSVQCFSCTFGGAGELTTNNLSVDVFNNGGNLLCEDCRFVLGPNETNAFGYMGGFSGAAASFHHSQFYNQNTGATNNLIASNTSGSVITAEGSTFVPGSGKTYSDAVGAILFDQGRNGGLGAGAPTIHGSVIGQPSVTGTALTAPKLALSANWGTSAAVSAPQGYNSPITFTITNGTAAVGASPTITYTFPSVYMVAPLYCTATQVGGTNPAGTFTAGTPITTSVVFTYSLTPTINDTELMQVTCSVAQ